jgi:hypothetical protein
VSAVEDPAMLDPGCTQRGYPFSIAGFLDVDVAAARCGEHELRIDPRRHRAERVDDTSAQRDVSPLSARLFGIFRTPCVRVAPSAR